MKDTAKTSQKKGGAQPISAFFPVEKKPGRPKKTKRETLGSIFAEADKRQKPAAADKNALLFPSYCAPVGTNPQSLGCGLYSPFLIYGCASYTSRPPPANQQKPSARESILSPDNRSLEKVHAHTSPTRVARSSAPGTHTHTH